MNPLLDTVEPDAILCPDGDLFTPGFLTPDSEARMKKCFVEDKVESLLSQCRKEALLEAAKELVDAGFLGAGGFVRRMAEGQHCMCPACKDGVIHDSDCAVHNAPALPRGPCDCGRTVEGAG